MKDGPKMILRDALVRHESAATKTEAQIKILEEEIAVLRTDLARFTQYRNEIQEELAE